MRQICSIAKCTKAAADAVSAQVQALQKEQVPQADWQHARQPVGPQRQPAHPPRAVARHAKPRAARRPAGCPPRAVAPSAAPQRQVCSPQHCTLVHNPHPDRSLRRRPRPLHAHCRGAHSQTCRQHTRQLRLRHQQRQVRTRRPAHRDRQHPAACAKSSTDHGDDAACCCCWRNHAGHRWHPDVGKCHAVGRQHCPKQPHPHCHWPGCTHWHCRRHPRRANLHHSPQLRCPAHHHSHIPGSQRPHSAQQSVAGYVDHRPRRALARTHPREPKSLHYHNAATALIVKRAARHTHRLRAGPHPTWNCARQLRPEPVHRHCRARYSPHCRFGSTGQAANATVGGVACAAVSVNGLGTQLACTIPGGVGPGAQAVRVTRGALNDQSGRSIVVVQAFGLAGVSPGEGASGTVVNITGNGLLGGVGTLGAGDVAVVVSGTAQLGTVVQVGASWVTAAMPVGAAGPVAVWVRLFGTVLSTNSVAFAYIGVPTVASVVPPTATAGSIITVVGTGFGTSSGVLAVTVGGAACTNLTLLVPETQLTCVLAAGLAVGAAAVGVQRSGTAAQGSVWVRIVDECAVLGAAYLALGGSGWSNSSGWAAGGAACCAWFGVTCNSAGRVSGLALRANGLSGVLPVSLGNLFFLESLDLSGNSISGGLGALCNATNLAHVDLGGNAVAGSIPGCVAGLPLVDLDLSQNSLTATIPPQLGFSSTLVSLALSENQLEGPLPAGGFASLRVLDVFGNRLSGAVPPVGVGVLEWADLGSNSFSGALPAQFCGLNHSAVGCNFFATACGVPGALDSGADCVSRGAVQPHIKNTCQRDGRYLDVFGSSCVSDCGQFVPTVVGPTTTQCRSNVSCTPGCALCNGPGLAISAYNCTLCDPTAGFALTLDGAACVGSCGPSQVVSVEGGVAQCQCDYSGGWFPNSGKSGCLSCPSRNQYIGTDNTCKFCHPDCASCTGGSAGECLTCPFGVEFRSSGGGCTGSCATCADSFVRRPGSSECVCAPGTALESGACVACPPNTYSAVYGTGSRCEACGAFRVTEAGSRRTSAADCVCASTFVEVDGACVCPAGTLYDSASGSCLACPVDTFSEVGSTSSECLRCGDLGAYRTTNGLYGQNSSAACGCSATMQRQGADCVCEAGSYLELVGGVTQCRSCGPDTYADARNEAACVACSAIGRFRTTRGVAGSNSSLACVCPATMVEQGSDCACAAGFYFESSTTTCRECAADYFTETPNVEAGCTWCGVVGRFRTTQRAVGSSSSAACVCPGTFVEDSATGECLCEAGYRHDASTGTCRICEAETFSEQPGVEPACTPCDSVGAHRTTRGQSGSVAPSECVCTSGYFPTRSGAGCEPCSLLQGSAECNGGMPGNGSAIAQAGVEVAAGYWLTTRPQFLKQAGQSSEAAWFRIHKCPVRAGCPGGPEEEHCAEGYEGPVCGICSSGYGRLGELCAQCPSSAVSAFLVFVISALVVAGCAGVVMFSRSGGQDVRVLDDAGSMQRLKIAITHLQIIGFTTDFASQWPNVLVRVLSIPASAATISSATDNIATDCATHPTLYSRGLVVLLLPAILAAGVGAGYAVLGAVRGDFSEVRTKAQQGTLVLLYVAHPGIVQSLMKLMVCVDVGSESFARSDMRVSCDDPAFTALRAFAVVHLLLYGFGGLATLFWLMRRNPDAFGFLTKGYKEEWFFWDLVVTVRKIFFAIVSLFASPPVQIFFSTWILLVSWMAHLFAKPYHAALLASMETLSLAVLLITVTTGMLYLNGVLGVGDVGGFAVSVLLILLNFGALFLFIFLAAKKGIRDRASSRHMAALRLTAL
eukprot:TRINITY_DN1108_c0_g2_i5.p1 TRINITY_DN1108_c0_g2~~TRINITY_DN1108_c0_g2_i5.p1  ORF type:complete len:1805 (-),score=239.12 TRINITY_DN1108_c0_g2_i5:107-5521(-)